MYCDLWPYVLWTLDFQIQNKNSFHGNYMRKYGNKKKYLIIFFSSMFKSVKSPASGKENVRFWDWPLWPFSTWIIKFEQDLKDPGFGSLKLCQFWSKKNIYFRLLVMKLWRMSQCPQPRPPRFKNWSPRMAPMQPNLPLIQVKKCQNWILDTIITFKLVIFYTLK